MLSGLLPTLFVVFWVAVIVLMAAVPTTTMHKGLWRAHRTDTGLVWFDSDLGRFGFPHSNTFAVQQHRDPERQIPTSHVVSLRFTYQRLESREALEAVGVDLRLRRHWPRQLDRYDVAVVTAAGDIPVFLAGQVFMAPPVGGWLVTRAVEWLDHWGLVPDVEAHARAVVDDLQREFARRGNSVSLA